jgi:Carboxypeptidase regulatory-like domain
MAPAPVVDIDVRHVGSGAQLDVPLTLLGRRQDLAEAENEQEISRPRTTLSPGHWEMRARIPAGQYVESITAQRGSSRRTWSVDHPPDWFEVFIDMRSTRILITVSDQAGRITGKVTADKLTGDGKPVAGAPVFLWPVAESGRRSLNGPVQTLSDTEGHYRFDSLPPGDYRVLSSFDVNEIDQDLIELSQAPVVHADASQTATIDLTVWVAPW